MDIRYSGGRRTQQPSQDGEAAYDKEGEGVKRLEGVNCMNEACSREMTYKEEAKVFFKEFMKRRRTFLLYVESTGIPVDSTYKRKVLLLFINSLKNTFASSL